MRDMDVLRDRLDILNTMEPYIGEWFSKYVQKHVFRMTDEEIKRIQQINKEPPPPDDDDDNDRDDSPDRDDFPDREEEENQLDSQR